MRNQIISYCLLIVFGLFPSLSWGKVYDVKEVSFLKVNSAITPATYDYMKYQFSRAPKDALIVISLNTPGGLVTTTKDIITLIGAQSRPVVVWITPEGASASSAGAIIAAAAHFIIMSPGSNMGAATPVAMNSDMKEGDGRNKIIKDLTSLVRSLSQSRGRPSAPFESMIKSAESYTDKEALKLRIIDGVTSSPGDLLTLLDGKSFTIKGETFTLDVKNKPRYQDYDPTTGQKLLEVLANPSTAFILFMIGIALIYIEFQAPGGFIAGGFGVALLVLTAISFQVLPLNWGALGLIFVGLVLLVLEIFVTSFGLLSIAGVGALIMGSLFLFHGDTGLISVEYSVIYSTLAGFILAVGFLVWYLYNDKKKQTKLGHFFLPVNHEGVVVNQLSSTTGENYYQIKVRGEIWKAKTSEQFTIGERILVTSVNHQQLLANIQKINTEE